MPIPVLDTTPHANVPYREQHLVPTNQLESSAPDAYYSDYTAVAASLRSYQYNMQVAHDAGKEITQAKNMEHFSNIGKVWNVMHPDIPCYTVLDGDVDATIKAFLENKSARPIEFLLVGFDSKREDLTKGRPTKHKQLIVMNKQDEKSAFMVIDTSVARNMEKAHPFFEKTIAETPNSRYGYYIPHIQQSSVGCSNYIEFFMRTFASEKKGNALLNTLLAHLRDGTYPEQYQAREARFEQQDYSDDPKLQKSQKDFFALKKDLQAIKNVQVIEGRLILPARMYKYTTYMDTDHDIRIGADDIIKLRESVGDFDFAKQPVNTAKQTLKEYISKHLVRKEHLWRQKELPSGEKIPLLVTAMLNDALVQGILRTLKKQLMHLENTAPFLESGIP